MILNVKDWTEDELGFILYQALSITIDQPAPYYELTDDEKLYYSAAAADFVQSLETRQRAIRGKLRKPLYVFDFSDNRAKRMWLTCPDRRYPHKWIQLKDRTKFQLFLGSTCFETKEEALRYGRDTLKDYWESVGESIDKVDSYIQAEQEELHKEWANDLEIQKIDPICAGGVLVAPDEHTDE